MVWGQHCGLIQAHSKLLTTRNNVATKTLFHSVFNNLFRPVKLLVHVLHSQLISIFLTSLVIHEASIKKSTFFASYFSIPLGV